MGIATPIDIRFVFGVQPPKHAPAVTHLIEEILRRDLCLDKAIDFQRVKSVVKASAENKQPIRNENSKRNGQPAAGQQKNGWPRSHNSGDQPGKIASPGLAMPT